MIQRLPKIGEVIKVWWSSPQGESRAKVISVRCYNGTNTNCFTHMIGLTSNTPRGWIEIAWNKDNPVWEWYIHRKLYDTTKENICN